LAFTQVRACSVLYLSHQPGSLHHSLSAC